jgi:hypothetical protein
VTALLPEELRGPVAARLQELEQHGFARRLWEHDASLWKRDAAHQKIISAALGWLSVPTDVRDELDDLRQFCAEVRAEGYTDAVLLGMGGSSLAPEVLRATFGVARGYLDLHVLDSTDPAAVLGLSEALDLTHSLFIVASKSGGTTETASFAAFFYERLQELCGEEAGRHFVAITDEGTSLQRQAVDQDFRAVFVNPSDIGGRYSALSFFGLVPAALTGLDLDHLLDHATDMVESCGPQRPAAENPGLVLGAALGELALRGRDKLTLLASPAIASFGAWVEQLVAESTGKEGTGVLPVDLEPAGAVAAYGDDRAFVYVRLACQPESAQDQLTRDLAATGQRVLPLGGGHGSRGSASEHRSLRPAQRAGEQGQHQTPLGRLREDWPAAGRDFRPRRRADLRAGRRCGPPGGPVRLVRPGSGGRLRGPAGLRVPERACLDRAAACSRSGARSLAGGHNARLRAALSALHGSVSQGWPQQRRVPAARGA